MSGFGLPLPNPMFQAFDDNGGPLALGKVYCYAAGTVSTVQDVYTTQALTVPIVQPVQLDALGRALFFPDPTLAYKYVVKDANGVTKYSMDNIAQRLPVTATTPGPTTVVGIPVGGILPYGGAAAPSGFFLCDGSGKSMINYPALYAVLGETFGGDGIDTFNLPDLRARLPIGKSAGGIAAVLGALFGTLSHTHAYSDVIAHTHNVFSNHGGAAGAQDSIGDTDFGSQAVFAEKDSVATHAVVQATGDAGGNTGTANPPCLVLNFIIRY